MLTLNESDSNYYVDNHGEPFPLSPFKSVQVPFVYGNPNAEYVDFEKPAVTEAELLLDKTSA